MPIRKNALKSANEEYTKIVEVANRYAIHNPSVGFSVKKFGEGTPDLKTLPDSTTLRNIGIVYGAALAKVFVNVINLIGFILKILIPGMSTV